MKEHPAKARLSTRILALTNTEQIGEKLTRTAPVMSSKAALALSDAIEEYVRAILTHPTQDGDRG